MRTQNINRICGDTIQTVNLSKSVSIQQTAHLNQPTNKNTPYSNNVCNSNIQKQQVYIKRTSKTSLPSKTACWRRNSNKLEVVQWPHDTKHVTWTGFTAWNHRKTKRKNCILERKLGNLDSNISVLVSQLALANHVADVLQEKLDDLAQYSHWPWLVIAGMRRCKNETKASVTKSIIDIRKVDI